MFEFAWSWMFFILPLPFIIRLILPTQEEDTSALKITFIHELEAITKQTAYAIQPKWKKSLPFLLIWCLLVTAAARPQWISDTLPAQPTGRDLLLAVDASGSMEMNDISWQGQNVNRLKLIKVLFKPFIENRVGDRIGLILFGSQAYMQAPLTFDRETVKKWLDESMIGIAGTQTAIGDAIGLAVKQLYDKDQKSRILILITDDSNNSGTLTPEAALRLAVQAKVKIYTIGIGSDKMVSYGFSSYSASADLDEDILKEIAATTGGKYFRARSEKDLLNISQELDKLEPINQEDQQIRYIKECYIWPFALAVLLSLLLIIQKLFPNVFAWRPYA